jgi:hypothetical protein
MFRKENPGKQPDHGQFLGMSQWTEGFDPVYVSWFCDDNWRLGMDQLFHSPKKARRRRQSSSSCRWSSRAASWVISSSRVVSHAVTRPPQRSCCVSGVAHIVVPVGWRQPT